MPIQGWTIVKNFCGNQGDCLIEVWHLFKYIHWKLKTPFGRGQVLLALNVLKEQLLVDWMFLVVDGWGGGDLVLTKMFMPFYRYFSGIR